MNTSIKPLTLFKERGSYTGRMQLVRPGGEVEEVDTSTHEDAVRKPAPDPAEDGITRDRVAEIKARRAKQLEQQRAQESNRQAKSPNVSKSRAISADEALEDYLHEVQTSELESLQKLEKYFWALMRVMAKKGFVTKEEFLREIKE